MNPHDLEISNNSMFPLMELKSMILESYKKHILTKYHPSYVKHASEHSSNHKKYEEIINKDETVASPIQKYSLH